MGTAVVGAPEFKARSGRTVNVGEDGSLSIDRKRGYLSPEVVMDAEEFFQAREDARRGRWRQPENPDYVVYPSRDEDSVMVIDERDGSSAAYDRSDSNAEVDRWKPHREAALSYFEAHPERKPWVDASPGEVWVLTLPDPGDVDAEIVTVATTYGTFTAGSLREWTLNDEQIITARRVPTEDAS